MNLAISVLNHRVHLHRVLHTTILATNILHCEKEPGGRAVPRSYLPKEGPPAVEEEGDLVHVKVHANSEEAPGRHHRPALVGRQQELLPHPWRIGRKRDVAGVKVGEGGVPDVDSDPVAEAVDGEDAVLLHLPVALRVDNIPPARAICGHDPEASLVLGPQEPAPEGEGRGTHPRYLR